MSPFLVNASVLICNYLLAFKLEFRNVTMTTTHDNTQHPHSENNSPPKTAFPLQEIREGEREGSTLHINVQIVVNVVKQHVVKLNK